MEAFYTLQGEGYHTGKPAYFIRLGGCDVGCHWCDVKESWEALDHPLVSLDKIIRGAKEHYPALVVVTGGEPMMYDLNKLCSGLKNSGLKTHLETSGAYPISGDWDWICFSPKKFKAPKPEVYQMADELKIVIFHPSDLQWAEEHAEMVDEKCKRYLQPEWSVAEKTMPLIVEYIKSNPKWQMSLQTHKYLNIP
jgi:organic radical activating enzyme